MEEEVWLVPALAVSGGNVLLKELIENSPYFEVTESSRVIKIYTAKELLEELQQFLMYYDPQYDSSHSRVTMVVDISYVNLLYSIVQV